MTTSVPEIQCKAGRAPRGRSGALRWARRAAVWAPCLLVLAACEPTNQGYEPVQPIEYSHAIHAGQFRIPCQYCHDKASTSRHAGIPPADRCMNCHTQVQARSPRGRADLRQVAEAVRLNRPIRWVRVNRLPDFAYFNHSFHVTAGVACQQCHGTVETMARVRQEQPLTMGWCLDCHRQTNLRLGTDGGVERLASTDCSACHY